MTPDERMTIDERDKYLRTMQKRYRKAKSKKEKSQLLDEMAAVRVIAESVDWLCAQRLTRACARVWRP